MTSHAWPAGGAQMSCRPGRERHRTTGLLLAGAGLLASGWLLAGAPGRPQAWVPDSEATVIERLPRGYATLMPTGPAPVSGALPSLPEAERLLATAAATGDARLAARAAGLLARLGDHNAPAMLRARAFSAQHQHDFSAAVALLDRVIALESRDGDARLARAQIELVRGNLDRARADCVALALGVDAGRGMLCVAALALRRGQHADAARLSERWLAQAPADDPLRRHALLQRAEIAARAGDPAAETWFRDAHALAPDDVRTLSAHARHLRAAGRHRDLLALLAQAPDSDGIALQRALAAHALGLAEAPALLARQSRRYRLARALGSEPELRDEAELLLARGDAHAALALAQRNFAGQRDHEDVDLLLRAASAGGRPDALHGLRRWAASQGVALAVAEAPP